MKSKLANIEKGADSKLQATASHHADILESGRVLSIDPSSGSSGSMPGFCFLKGGTLIESGTFEITLGDIGRRLWSFSAALKDSFPEIDLLIVEDIPPFMQTRGTSFRSKGTVNLHMSVGAIYAACGYAPTILVPPIAWHAVSRKLPFTYHKGDENDALMLALAVYTKAKVKAHGLVERIEERCNDVDTKALQRKAKGSPDSST